MPCRLRALHLCYSDSMRAMIINRLGEPDVFEQVDMPVPAPGPGEVLIRVAAVGINPVDWKTRQRGGSLGPDPQFPLIIGWDVSGTVAGLGAGVTAFGVGDEVYGLVGFPGRGDAYAEFTAKPANHVSGKPAGLSHVEAAALPLAALTAWQGLLEFAQLQARQRVLVHAAAGGVGHLAVQIAKARGAYVIGSPSTRNHGFLRDLGCDEMIDYTQAPFETQVEPVDVVLDCYGADTGVRALSLVRPGGALVSIAGAVPTEAAVARRVRTARILVRPSAEHLAAIADLVARGQLRPTIEAVFPLERVADAHRQLELGRTRGKIVLEVGS